MKRSFFVFTGLIVLSTIMACAGHDVRSPKNSEQVIEEANHSLPRRIDPATTLEKVTKDGSALTYHYIIDLKASDIPKEHWQHALNERVERACVNGHGSYFSVIFKMFDGIYYDLRDKDGRTLALTWIDKGTCH